MKGNGDEYFLHLRNRSSRLPWQYYYASFKSEPTWKEVNISFQKFKVAVTEEASGVFQTCLICCYKNPGIFRFSPDA